MYTVIGSTKTRAFRVVWMLEELVRPRQRPVTNVVAMFVVVVTFLLERLIPSFLQAQQGGKRFWREFVDLRQILRMVATDFELRAAFQQ